MKRCASRKREFGEHAERRLEMLDLARPSSV